MYVYWYGSMVRSQLKVCWQIYQEALVRNGIATSPIAFILQERTQVVIQSLNKQLTSYMFFSQ